MKSSLAASVPGVLVSHFAKETGVHLAEVFDGIAGLCRIRDLDAANEQVKRRFVPGGQALPPELGGFGRWPAHAVATVGCDGGGWFLIRAFKFFHMCVRA
jgi:hypothetical protein